MRCYICMYILYTYIYIYTFIKNNGVEIRAIGNVPLTEDSVNEWQIMGRFR